MHAWSRARDEKSHTLSECVLPNLLAMLSRLGDHLGVLLLEGSEDGNIERLHLVRGVRGEGEDADLALICCINHLKRAVGGMAILVKGRRCGRDRRGRREGGESE
jgi:hypothetical protein